MSEIKCKSYKEKGKISECKERKERNCGQPPTLCCIDCSRYLAYNDQLTVVCDKVCYRLEEE